MLSYHHKDVHPQVNLRVVRLEEDPVVPAAGARLPLIQHTWCRSTRGLMWSTVCPPPPLLVQVQQVVLQRPLGHPPEQLPSLLGRHGVAALQQVGDDEGLLEAAGLHPQTAVHSHHQLTGEQLLQV